MDIARTQILIDDEWIIETGSKNDGSNRKYYYLLHKHKSMRTMLTVPAPTEHERICASCNTRVPSHIAGFLMLCRWEA